MGLFSDLGKMAIKKGKETMQESNGSYEKCEFWSVDEICRELRYGMSMGEAMGYQRRIREKCKYYSLDELEEMHKKMMDQRNPKAARPFAELANERYKDMGLSRR